MFWTIVLALLFVHLVIGPVLAFLLSFTEGRPTPPAPPAIAGRRPFDDLAD
jgi:hypothetical protein